MSKKLTTDDVVESQFDSIIDDILKEDISNKEKIKKLQSSKAKIQGSGDFMEKDREKFDKAINELENPVKPPTKKKHGLLEKYLTKDEHTAAKKAFKKIGGRRKKRRKSLFKKKRTKKRRGYGRKSPKRTKKKRRRKKSRKRKSRRKNGGHHSFFW